MKRFILLICYALQAFCAPAVVENTCQMTGTLQEVQWHTMQKKQRWVRTMTTDDPMANALPCEVLYHIEEKCPGVITVEGMKFDDNFKTLHVTGTAERKGPGVYRMIQQNTTDDLVSTVESSKYAEKDHNIVEEMETFAKEDNFYITDSTTYFIAVFCSSKGNWNVWVFTPNIEPTSDEMMNANAALVDHGIHVDLHFGHCKAALEHYCKICK